MKKLSYTNLMSHQNKKLEDHLENVAKFSNESFNSLFFSNNNLFSEISFFIGLGHDFAKSTSFFQDYLSTNNPNENTPHSFLSSIFTYYIVNNYITNQGIDFNEDLAIISYIVVLHHHGNIKNIPDLFNYHKKTLNLKRIKNQLNDIISSDNRLDLFYNQWDINLSDFFDNFNDINDELINKLFFLDYNENLNYYFYIVLFYSILLDADKMDASESNTVHRKFISDDIVDDYKYEHFSNIFDGINKIRQEAYAEVNENVNSLNLSDRIFSINLPTGIGKTLTGLSCVLKLKNRINDELGINPRIIYSLPFLSVIDQNEEVIHDIFDFFDLKGSNYLLKHNYLANMKYVDSDENEIYGIDNSKILIEGWNSEFIITTFIQFFYSIIGNKNSFFRKFHNITNSIILLDEIQSIPHKYWNIINIILQKLAQDYNCWIILMTATQPFIFKKNEIMPLVKNSEYYFDKFNRVEYNFNLDDVYLDDFSDIFIECINENCGKNIMAVLNTVDSSKELYTYVKDYFIDKGYEYCIDNDGICQIDGNLQLIYLSTNIVPYQRLKKINKIKCSNKRCIIITTQLIEAGVDIDVDIVFRDLAPLDSIIQTAGRCNRAGDKDKGIVNIVSIKNNNNDKLYSNLVYDSLLINITREVLNNLDCVEENDFNFNASNKYFELLDNRKESYNDLNEDFYYLRFEDINSNFKLIENELPKIDVFVCLNQNAESIFNEYKKIVKSYDGFDKKNAFLKIKNNFYNYVISVDEKKLGSTNIYNKEIGVVYLDELNRKYDLDLGFIYGDDEDAFIL